MSHRPRCWVPLPSSASRERARGRRRRPCPHVYRRLCGSQLLPPSLLLSQRRHCHHCKLLLCVSSPPPLSLSPSSRGTGRERGFASEGENLEGRAATRAAAMPNRLSCRRRRLCPNCHQIRRCRSFWPSLYCQRTPLPPLRSTAGKGFKLVFLSVEFPGTSSSLHVFHATTAA